MLYVFTWMYGILYRTQGKEFQRGAAAILTVMYGGELLYRIRSISRPGRLPKSF